MDVIVYLLFICLVIYIVITLLPVILSITTIIMIVFSILIWYVKRKVHRYMEGYKSEWSQQQEEYTTGNNSNLDSDDVIDVEFTERDDEQRMLRDAGKQNKAEIHELRKQSYSNQNQNYLNFYFKNTFDKGRCIALEQDQRIISSLQLNEHILHLHDKQLKTSYILGVSMLPDYRRKGHMRKLMESALNETGYNHLVTLIRGFYPKPYEQFGLKIVYERKLYTVPKEYLHKVSLTNISYAVEPQELLQAYQNFTKHFGGCYVRDREYYVLLQNETVVTQKQMVVYRNRQGEICGYLIFHKRKQEIHVGEAIYLKSVVLMRLLKAATGKEQEILVEVSQSEKLEKIFSPLIPKKQPFIMARINNPELFNKLYNLEVKPVAEAFASALWPLWIHEYY